MDLIAVENRRDLKKDLRSNAIINVDKEAYQNYLTLSKAKREEKEQLDKRIVSLESKVDDIFDKLNIILERVSK
jgi:hypothetical protein